MTQVFLYMLGLGQTGMWRSSNNIRVILVAEAGTGRAFISALLQRMKKQGFCLKLATIIKQYWLFLGGAVIVGLRFVSPVTEGIQHF